MTSAVEGTTATPASRSREVMSFLILTVLLAPVLSVGIVGGLGFAIWIFQMIYGPPGPPPA
jgi:nitrate reductase NapE